MILNLITHHWLHIVVVVGIVFSWREHCGWKHERELPQWWIEGNRKYASKGTEG